MLRNSSHNLCSPKMAFARRLRANQTPGEKVFWRRIRAKRFHGYKFRRQVPIGPYIVDFLCIERKLIVEIDGDSHCRPGAKERDVKREHYLRLQGFDVLRFGECQVMQDLDSVLEKLGRVLSFSAN